MMTQADPLESAACDTEQYRLLFELNPTPMWVFEAATLRFLAVNAAAVRQYGYTCEEFLARTVRDILPNEQSAKFEHSLPFATSASVTRHWRHCRKNGSELTASVFVGPVRFDNRAAWMSIATDVTEQQRADLKVRQSEANLALAQRVARLGSWEVDVTDRAERAKNPPRWSDETFRIFGLAPGGLEVTHDSFFRLLHPEEREAAKATFVQQLRTGTPYSADHRIIRPDGSERLVHVVSDTVHDAGGRTVRLGGTVQDVTEKKRVEEALQMQARVIESMTEGVVVADSTGRIMQTNPALNRMYGYEPNELLGQPVAILQDLVDPEAEDRVVEMMSQARHSTWTGDVVRRRKDGSSFLTRTQLSAFEMSGRRHFFAVQEDITEQKQTEKALLETEEKFRSIFEKAVEGIFQTTPEGRVLAANPAFARILGFASAEEMCDYDIAKQGYVDPQRRGVLKQAMAEKGQVNGFESEMIRRDGQRVWVSENTRTVRGDDGEILFYEGTIEDITERKRDQQRIREQAELINLAHDAIIVRDLEDRILFWNCGAEKIYGWTAGEVLGRPITDLLHDNDQLFLEAKATLLETGEWRGEVQHFCKDGHKIVSCSRWTLVRDESGAPQSILVIHTDVTEQKKLEAQFLRSQRLESIGTLAAGVAHDLNNILAPIMLVSPLLRGEISESDKESFLALVQSNAERGASVVKQMLTFARGADGERVLMQPLYLLEEVTKVAEQTFPKSITVRTKYPEDLWLVEGDPTQLQQVLLNLCVNARDAMPKGGTLRLTSENFIVDEHFAAMTPEAKVGPHVLIKVSDNGTGIPREIMDKIFDPFFTTKDVGKGTGLGLSTVIGILKSYGGFVNVYSEPGHTSFKVYLPAKAGATLGANLPPAVSLPAGHGETILVVDDEPSIREAAETLLAMFGYKVLLAEDGIEALALLARHAAKVDVVITDMVMPFMDGVTLIRTVRKINPETRIIVSTGRDDGCNNETMNGLAPEACLLKPYTREKFLMTLDTVLHHRQVATT